ncbi:hypothetical protein [Aliiglaciecola litoralis]|uniref:SnoaL-like domain-containing protein n=1 Tax=Aliiglaciecola litoralis TaxID=582857 RepID=A0ABN1LJ83_9ALTE
MSDRMELFFSKYATALDNGDAEALSDLSVRPMIFVSDETKRICHSHKEVVEVNSNLIAGLGGGGVVKHQPTVTQSMRLSDTVLFVSVRWEFFDTNDAKLFSCICSYTLQIENDDSVKVLVLVVDDEQKIITELMKQAQE